MYGHKDILKDRAVAAQRLCDIIPMQKLKDEEWKILALSNGGVALGSFIRKNLTNNLSILYSHAVSAPQNQECEIARVSETEEIVINDELVKLFNIEYDYIYGEAHRQHEHEILSKIYKNRKGKKLPNIENEVVLLVDEGSESGITMMTALKTVLSMKPKAVYIAVGVIPADVYENLQPYADDIFYLYTIDDFVETSLYYEDLQEISDELVEKLLED